MSTIVLSHATPLPIRRRLTNKDGKQRLFPMPIVYVRKDEKATLVSPDIAA